MLDTIAEAAAHPGYADAERLGCLVGTEKFSWSIPKDGYEKTVEMEFEGHMLPCMSCWDECLYRAPWRLYAVATRGSAANPLSQSVAGK